jgi:hypothetical protein
MRTVPMMAVVAFVTLFRVSGVGAQSRVDPDTAAGGRVASAEEWWRLSPRVQRAPSPVPGAPVLRADTTTRSGPKEAAGVAPWLTRTSRPKSWMWQGLSVSTGLMIPPHEYRDPARRRLLAGRLGPPRWPTAGPDNHAVLVGPR